MNDPVTPGLIARVVAAVLVTVFVTVPMIRGFIRSRHTKPTEIKQEETDQETKEA